MPAGISAETMEAVLNPMPPYELDDTKNILLTIGGTEAPGMWNVDQSANREAINQFMVLVSHTRLTTQVTQRSGCTSGQLEDSSTQTAPLVPKRAGAVVSTLTMAPPLKKETEEEMVRRARLELAGQTPSGCDQVVDEGKVKALKE
eukprot:gene3388-4361_t